MDFILRNAAKAMEKHVIRRENKTLLDLDYADDFSVLDIHVWKMNEFLEVLRFQGARIGLKISAKI